MAIKYTLNLAMVGRGERIWTSDPIVPNDVRYQAAPLPDKLIQSLILISYLKYHVDKVISFETASQNY